MERVVGAVAVVALVAGLGWAAWWWTHPTVLASPTLSDEGGFTEATVKPGEAMYVGLADIGPTGPGEVLQFSGAQVDLGPTRSVAGRPRPTVTSSVLVCARSDGPGGLGIGAERDVADFCRKLRPLLSEGGRVDGQDQRETLYLRLEVSAPGRVLVDGITLDYRREGVLGQRGSQRIGADLTLRVR